MIARSGFLVDQLRVFELAVHVGFWEVSFGAELESKFRDKRSCNKRINMII